MDGMGVSLAVKSDMFVASNQRIPMLLGRNSSGRWRCCECEAMVGRDAVDGIQQDRSAGWNLQWEVVCERGLEIDDDARASGRPGT
jgi:hypothetical protein